ncbi:MAG TPA: hypothetical protein VM187_17360, partial [Niastella sp.]|nr:hypothetical protein [Niastella sp.]
MAQTNNATQAHNGSLTNRMLAGAAIGFVLICLFLISAGHADPFWPKLWFIRPLLIVPFAGAIGGLCNYYLVYFHNMMGVNKMVAMILSVVIFIIGLWLGSVLGLDGTY